MKLKCLSRYSNAKDFYEAGQEFEVDEKQAAFLMADSPGSFSQVVRSNGAPSEPKALKTPPANKMITEPEKVK
jgi:hypothetical protein